MTQEQIELRTNIFLRKDGKVCLAKKKRRYGANKFNGYGGKLDKDVSGSYIESLEKAAIRELFEESGSIAQEKDLKKMAVLTYQGQDDGAFMQVHVYILDSFQNEPTETEEMDTPIWVPFDSIPFHEMWQGDDRWLPKVLQDTFVTATLTYEGETFIDIAY